MGMFDSVRLEVSLPDDGDKLRGHAWWQTKDFDCIGELFTIAPDGQLYRDHDRYCEGFGAPMPFTGIMNFYTMDHEDNWFEYNATFSDGRLAKIDRVPQVQRHQDS